MKSVCRHSAARAVGEEPLIMRGQPGPYLAPGNYPAARRYVRGRKPPPILLWTIGIVTCLLFIGAAAMLTVGYLNPFGTVGLAILGVGAVVYFGAILFLVLSCLWVERKYPGMQPLSFKIYSRKPNRMPPTTLTNPNISGQIPVDTTPSYRIHNELPIQIPGFSDVGGKTDKIPSTPKDNSKERIENNPASHGSSPDHVKNPKGQSTALDILQEEDPNGGISQDDSPDIRLQEQTNNENVNLNEDTRANEITAAGIEDKSHSQPEQLKTKHGEGAMETQDTDKNKTGHQYNQNENYNDVSASQKIKRKVKFVTHHIEVPFEDYPSSDSSTSPLNKKDKSLDIQESFPKDNIKHISNTTENDNFLTTGANKSVSPAKTSDMDRQKEASSTVNNHPHQRTKTSAAHSTVKVEEITKEYLKPSSTHKRRSVEKDGKRQDNPQPPSSSQPAGSPAQARKQIPVKHQNNQESSHRAKDLTPTNSASPPADRKATERERHASRPTNSAQKNSELTPKSSPLRARKLLDVHKNNGTNPHHAQESVKENSQTSSLLDIGGNMLPHKNNQRNDQPKMTSPKHPTRNPDSLGGSPTHTHKMQSPERARKLKRDNAVPSSPPISRKADGSFPPSRHREKRPDHISKVQRTEEQSITIQNFSSSGRIEEIQKKHILHSSSSSDFPSSSSPPRQRQRSPNISPRLPRNSDHTTSKTAAFHSSTRNEEFSHRKIRHSSPSSQSSNVPSSPSSSPQRTRRKSPEMSTKMQRHKDISATSTASSPNNKKEELHKRHSQPSSQSSDVSSSLTSSSITAKKLLQYKKEQDGQNDENKSVPQQRTNN